MNQPQKNFSSSENIYMSDSSYQAISNFIEKSNSLNFDQWLNNEQSYDQKKQSKAFFPNKNPNKQKTDKKKVLNQQKKYQDWLIDPIKNEFSANIFSKIIDPNIGQQIWEEEQALRKDKRISLSQNKKTITLNNQIKGINFIQQSKKYQINLQKRDLFSNLNFKFKKQFHFLKDSQSLSNERKEQNTQSKFRYHMTLQQKFFPKGLENLPYYIRMTENQMCQRWQSLMNRQLTILKKDKTQRQDFIQKSKQ